jgi:predicted transcriptional regulator
MTMNNPPLGEQELKVLQHISAHAPITARDVIEHFANERSLARTTILTVMERLRKKGYLARRRIDGVFQYSPRVEQKEVLHGLARSFVEKTLGGSLSPLVVYLTKTRQVSDEELAELQQMVEELKANRNGRA